MLLLFLLTLHVSDVNGEGVCAEFSFESSHYKATFVRVTTAAGQKTWSEIKELCDEDYELVSITSEEENNVILDMLEDCTDGGYAIGLSREAGMERWSDSNWKWESGETTVRLFWASTEPNVPNSDCAIAYILTSNPEPSVWGDERCTDNFGTWIGSQGYGYICEKPITTTTQSTTTTAVIETTNRTRTTGADLHNNVSIPAFTEKEQNICSCEIENSRGSSAPGNLIVVVVILSVIILAGIPALIFYSRFYYHHKEKNAVVYDDDVLKNKTELSDEGYEVPMTITRDTYAQPESSNKEVNNPFDENIHAYTSISDPVYINSIK